MPKTQTITVPGPTIFGRLRSATVTITRNQSFATVEWTSQELEGCALTTEAFHKRLHLGNLGGLILKWRARYREELPKHSQKFGGTSRGTMTGLPFDLADDLAQLIADAFDEAMEGLPLVFSEEEVAEKLAQVR